MDVLPRKPVRVQAPANEGVGLKIPLPRIVPPEWPADWWQRNYDDAWEPDAPDPIPLTARMKTIPPPPKGAT
jgi:hypothetical protein